MKSSGDKDGYFGSKVGASYIDNPESVYNSLEHYINARTHIFPPNIAVILKNASLDTDANFRSNNPRSWTQSNIEKLCGIIKVLHTQDEIVNTMCCLISK
jgi:hypothetical protein